MPKRTALRLLGQAVVAVATAFLAVPAPASYVLFESGQVRPLALSPNGSKLFAVNTPDNRLEIFAVGAGGLTRTGSVEVGMEPVAVAARTDTEVWVVNHLSDTVSIVDVSATPRVVRTLLVGDEPRDIVFAGTGSTRAFITTARRGQNLPASMPPLLTTAGTPRALVFVFDATNLGTTLEGTPLTIVPLFGDTPRALAVSPDGSTVYAAVFHSGNQTTTVTEGAVCDDGNLNNNTPQGPCTVLGVTMPGGLPNPERSADNATRPETGLIVKFNQAAGQWRDQLNRNWNNAVRFDLPDFDVFKISANANPPVQLGIDDTQFAHVGTVLFNMVANPVSGKVYVSNTEARNEVRFEGPGIIGGSTVRSHLHEARVTVLDGSSVLPRPLNKHINYGVVPSPPGTAAASLATPVGLAVNSAGTRLYVAAFGSQKIGVFDTARLENDTFTTQPQDGVSHVALGGGGPTGLVIDEARSRLYVLTRFDNAVRIVDTTTLVEQTALRRPLYSPEPASVADGRRFLYDAAFTSSNGEASCGACHVFGDFDSLGWDLGNPDDAVLTNQNPIRVPGGNANFHPMKGPMTTQSLRGMANHGPMHWRGDRTGGLDEPSAQPDSGAFNEDLAFKKFNGAFVGLLGRATELTSTEMQQFTDFILQETYPPNPIRNLDNSLTAVQQAGRNLYFGAVTDTLFNCNGCHVLNTSQGFFGTDGFTTFENEPQMMKIAHLRNLYQKVGMFGMPAVSFLGNQSNTHTGRQVRGFGFLHDGSVDTVARFLSATVFSTNATQEAQIEQFALAFDSNLAPVVGQQATLTSANSALLALSNRLNLFEQRAAQSECDVIVKGTFGGQQRGWVRQADGTFRSDRSSEPPATSAQVRFLVASPGQELTYTCVPPGSGERMGIDRDEDGYFDRDELDAGSDPADPLAIPVGTTATTLAPTKKLLITNAAPDDESRNKVVIQSRSASITVPVPGGADDPRCNGDPAGTVKATLSVSSATSGQTHTTNLPCQNWDVIGNFASPQGYKYADPELDDGTALKVIWKSGSQLKAMLFGKGPTTLDYDLETGVGQGAVRAKLVSDSFALCMSCTGGPGDDGSDGRMFLGRDCPAPATCTP